MKKTLITLLIISLFSFGLFADNPTSSFDVTTTVGPKNEMKLTTTDATLANPAVVTLETLVEFESDVTIDSTGETEPFTAFISALSNNADGFTVTMSATPMVSDTDGTHGYEIDYTVTAGTAGGATVSYTTNDTEGAVTVFNISGITALTPYSKALSIAVVQDSFNKAVEDDYKGTVTFTYEAK